MGSHIQVSANPFKSWEYCSKEESRVEGPVSFGPCPKPSKVKGANYAEFNKRVISGDLEAMVASGEVHLRDYKKLESARLLYKLKTEKLASRPSLTNYWYCGPSGSGKSKKAREDDP